MKRPDGHTVSVDKRDFVRVDGVKIGKRIKGADGKARLQVCDKDRRRSAERGTRLVEVVPRELADILEEEDTDEDEREEGDRCGT